MLNIDRALGGDRLIKAMTGLSTSEFNELIESFGEEFQNEARTNNPSRQVASRLYSLIILDGFSRLSMTRR